MSISTPAHPKATRGWWIALASAAILSTTAIFIRYLTQAYHIPALVLAFWRDVFVASTLLTVLGLWRPRLLQVRRQDLLYLAAYGLVLAVFNALWTLSVSLNGAAISTVLAYSSAGFTVLLGRWLLKERLDWAKLLAVGFSLGGCVLVSGALDAAAWRTGGVGILAGIFSGLGYSLYSLMGRSASQRGLDAWTIVLYVFGLAAGYLLGLNLLLGGRLPGTSARPADLFWLGKALSGWGILFVLAAGPTLGGYGLYNVSLAYLPSSIANLIVTIEPVFTATTAYLLLGERLTGIQIGGGGLIMAGVVLLRIRESRLVRASQSRARVGTS
jgi:drug/metabolite transporter (DMT)-like permease